MWVPQAPGQVLALAAQGTPVRPCVRMSMCPLQQLTLRRAREQCLQTARLPIREYMVKVPNSRNYHSETLAINQGEGLHGAWRVTRESGVIQELGVIPCSWEAVHRAGDSQVEGFWGAAVGTDHRGMGLLRSVPLQPSLTMAGRGVGVVYPHGLAHLVTQRMCLCSFTLAR